MIRFDQKIKSFSWSIVSVAALTLLLSCGEKKSAEENAKAQGVTGEVVILNEKVSFNDHVMPILSDKCFHCHGPDAKNQKSEYRLDTEENAKKALEGR